GPVRRGVQQPDHSRQVGRRGNLGLQDGELLAVLGRVLGRGLELLELRLEAGLLLLGLVDVLLLGLDLTGLRGDQADYQDHAEDGSNERCDESWFPVHFLLPWTVAG